jgi:hypothetical protein
MNVVADRVSDGDDPKRSGCTLDGKTIESRQFRTPDGLNFVVQVCGSLACEAVWGRLELLTSLRPNPKSPIRVHMIVRRPNTRTVDATLDDFRWDLHEFGPHIFTSMLISTGDPFRWKFKSVTLEARVDSGPVDFGTHRAAEGSRAAVGPSALSENLERDSSFNRASRASLLLKTDYGNLTLPTHEKVRKSSTTPSH